MEYGAMNFPIKPLLKEIEEIGEMGFDYVELTMDPPEATPQKILTQFWKEDNHLPIGAGIIDLEKILAELNETRYDETLTLEVFSRDREYLKISKEKIKRIGEAP